MVIFLYNIVLSALLCNIYIWNHLTENRVKALVGLNSNNAEPKCSGKNCGKLATTLLKILYIINKTGFFCDFCTLYLLQKGLAAKGGESH